LIGSFVSVVHGKTGFVTESGYNVVSEITDGKGHTVLGVVLGSATNDDRFHDFKMMAHWVWENFTWPDI
jgi:D-alanyl-D-alanine carboxypeptidase